MEERHTNHAMSGRYLKLLDIQGVSAFPINAASAGDGFVLNVSGACPVGDSYNSQTFMEQDFVCIWDLILTAYHGVDTD